MLFRIAIIIACAGLLGGSALAQATIGGEWRDEIERFAARVVEAGLAPGLGIAVSQGEWVLYEGGFGVADAASGRRVSANTPFYVASSTKALTATAVVLLAARGEMELGAPITRYVPGLRFRPPLDARSVTIGRLLTMTDGIEQKGAVVMRTAYTGEFTPELLVELLAGYGPSAEGNAFDYRNLPYNILGLALDPADGHGWKDVVDREVLRPLGMSSTSARLSALEPDRLAMPHALAPLVAGEGWGRIPLAKADENLHAAGGHFATPRDLIRFVAAHASHGRLEGRRLFPAAAIASMHEARVPQSRDFGPFRRTAWGYGWDVAEWRGRTIVQRFGAFSGYRSHMSFEPATGIGVVVLTNGSGIASPAADLVATWVYDRLAGRADLEAEYERQLAELQARRDGWKTGTAAHLRERAARLAPLSRPLEDFAGTYESPELGRIVWLVVAGGLEARAGVARSRAEVFDAAGSQLRIEIGGGVVATFEFPEGGDPASAVVIQGERFVRVEPE
ncbi:MAG TPA: serine hydrolase domain-containing protein [Thermoanaerobaculia bacterium]|nr:serine hydrolase domain-containing protein [Thermoanaerobaculia bacterium]